MCDPLDGDDYDLFPDRRPDVSEHTAENGWTLDAEATARAAAMSEEEADTILRDVLRPRVIPPGKGDRS